MKTITCWNDLAPYGIDVLTGEACGLSYRLLCDVTAQGKAILEKLFSIPSIGLAENWNQGDPPHIGSIMLAPELLFPLGIFALLEAGCTEVWRLPDRLVGIEPTDSPEEVAALKDVYREPVRRFAYRGTAGDRHIHRMSGRIR